MIANDLARFLLAGGFAAFVNWLARIALSIVLPLETAIICAYAIGMLLGFFLYRNFVFCQRDGSIRRQVFLFLGVNALGAFVVLIVALGLTKLITLSMPSLSNFTTEALAHGLAIGIGAIANFLGHRALTFGSIARYPSHQRR